MTVSSFRTQQVPTSSNAEPAARPIPAAISPFGFGDLGGCDDYYLETMPEPARPATSAPNFAPLKDILSDLAGADPVFGAAYSKR